MTTRALFAAAILGAFARGQVTRAMEPDLAAIELPILEAARERPEALFAFLTDPETPYAHALAAAQRCREAFPIASLEPLFLARGELRREQLLHLFGFEWPREWSGGDFPRAGEVPRERRVLGRSWTLPATRQPYPRTFADAERAPWPWRVREVLERTVGSIQPLGSEVELPRTLAWMAECTRWRIDDDDRAEAFFEATLCPWHTKTLPVLARWRRILLDPDTPRTAVRIAGALGEAHRQLLWGDPEGRLACQLIAGDGVRGSPHRLAKQECCYQLRALSRRCVFDGGKLPEQEAPLPVEAVVAAAELATTPDPQVPGDAWTRLYVQAFSICEAVREPPFPVRRSMDHQSPEVSLLLTRFEQWWKQQRPVCEKQVQERAEAVTTLRRRLEAMAR